MDNINQATMSRAMSTTKVLRNTYMLLSMTLLVSSLTALYAISIKAPPVNIIILLAVLFGFPFLIGKFANSSIGIALVFAFTAFMGYTLGPLISHYLAMNAGTEIVATSLGLTAFIFLSLSGYVLTTGKNFNFMQGFLFTGIMVVVGVMVLSLVLRFFGINLPFLSLAISAAVVLLMSGLILYQTSEIIHGGETNYIMATVSLYMSIFNLFVHLLALVGFASRD